MNAVTFFLVVNFVVAVSFGAVFTVVATRSRSRDAALWLAAGFGVASLSAICELLVAYSTMPKVWALGAFITVLVGMMLLRVGTGLLYNRQICFWKLAVFVIASIIVAYLIYNFPRGTLLQAFAYQTPFALVMLSSASVVLRSARRQMIDLFLAALLVFTGLHFLLKAGLAVFVGSGTVATDYIRTNYALVSQSATAVLVVAVGLTFLAALVLEIMADQKNESEQDALSNLANRRGLDRLVQSLLAKAPAGRHAIILCDLDHFKLINDGYGHDVGDRVIQEFGRLLRGSAPIGAVLGRIGGEEFAVILANTELDTAVAVAQSLRNATTSLPNLPDGLTVTASFGVTTLSSAAGLAEAYKRADVALYNAKNAGRNRVKHRVAPRLSA